MSELKATPGPWEARKYRVYANNVHIASAWDAGEVDETKHTGESWLDMRGRVQPLLDARAAQTDANAALIAEAPAMYEELNDIVGQLRAALVVGDELSEPAMELIERRATALLKKARGEA